jgi:urease accessory protein
MKSNENAAVTIVVPEHIHTFAANRAVGGIALSVHATDGVSRCARIHEHGSLRARFPGARRGELEAVIVNTAGGIAGGDRFDFDISVGANASLVVSSAAAEKVYRTLGPDATVGVTLDVAAGASLAWLPQETILFDRARMRRTIDVALAPDARLILAEALVLGRTAMEEVVAEGRLFDRWRVRRAGRLVFAEGLRLDGAISAKLAETAVARGGVAVATVLIVPGEETPVAAIRALDGVRGEVGVSAWNGIAVTRLVAADGAALRLDLMMVLSALRGAALPRLWLN